MTKAVAGEIWEFVGPRELGDARGPGTTVLVLEETAVHHDVVVLHMEPDEFGWCVGARGRRWTISTAYGWQRVC